MFGHRLCLICCHFSWRNTERKWTSIHRYRKKVSKRGCGCTFAKRPLQQVVFGLQFGDEITALQKLPEFLWRIGSNYKAALSASLSVRSQDSHLWSDSYGQRTNWESFQSFYQSMSIFRLKQDSSWSDMRTFWKSYSSVSWSKRLGTWDLKSNRIAMHILSYIKAQSYFQDF